MIQANGLSINKDKFSDINGILNSGNLIEGKYILVQKGKKNYYTQFQLILYSIFTIMKRKEIRNENGESTRQLKIARELQKGIWPNS